MRVKVFHMNVLTVVAFFHIIKSITQIIYYSNNTTILKIDLLEQLLYCIRNMFTFSCLEEYINKLFES